MKISIEEFSRNGNKEISELEWIRHIHNTLTDCSVGLSGWGIDTHKDYIQQFNTHFKKEINEFHRLTQKLTDKVMVYVEENKLFDFDDK